MNLASDSDQTDKDNSFRNFRCLCADIAEENSYLGKTKILSDYLARGSGGGKANLSITKFCISADCSFTL